ncbi:peptidase M15 [Capybara microvirus Cap1_SP_22]|nr:peptidase M15 [Capybara microvirus Cap1_SP_22]
MSTNLTIQNLESCLNLQLTPHFNLKEFFVSSSNYECNLVDFSKCNNVDKIRYISNLHRLAHELEYVRECFDLPFVITSGWRSYTTNLHCGGAKRSRHMIGCAVDFHVDLSKDTKSFYNDGGYPKVCEFLLKSPFAKEIIQYVSRDGKVQWIHFSIAEDLRVKYDCKIATTTLAW